MIVGVIDELLERNASYGAEFAHGALSAPPEKGLAVVACMDARMDVHAILGLRPGDAHVIRNAGGVVTEDVLRSLVVSQHALGTREAMLIHHTECGMLGLDEDRLRDRVAVATGSAPTFPLASMSDLEGSVRESIERVRTSDFLVYEEVRGFIYEVRSGHLKEVPPPRS